ncbi:MAG: hypothetical protein QM656_02240 [Paracoccaceae bacterium]
MYLRSALCTVSFLALTGGAFAAPATQEGAARLTASFQTYLGKTPGVVTVTPAGETYDVRLDLAPLAALLPAEGGKIEASPLSYTLTDNGDGTWRVTEDQSFTLTIDAPNVMETTYRVDRMVSDGIWDENLPGFASQTVTLTGFGAETVSYDPDGQELSRSVQHTDSMTVTSTGKAGAAGGTDAAVSYTATGLSQTVSVPTAPDAPPTAMQMQAASYEGDLKIEALKSREVLGLIGWLVAHPSKQAVTGAQDEMRGLVTGALPVFKTLDGTMAVNDIVLQTPIGAFTATGLTGTIGANGVVSDGRFREAITVKGVAIPPGLAPDWAAQLVPTEIGLDMTVSGFDLAAPAQLVLKSFDLNKPEPVDPSLDQQLGQLILPKGTVNITLAPGQAAGPLYTLGYEGRMIAGPGLVPTGTARVTAQGLDKVQEELAKAPEEVRNQALMPLAMAMGLARDENGTLVWEIDASTPGSLKVNGTDLMGGAAAQ